MFMSPQNIDHHLNHFRCYISGFLHQCIYTLRHIPKGGTFYLVSMQSQPLAVLLLYNTCHMESLDYGNLS